ncbi:unnamed protein product [Euphydryas editha]|uniref:Cuticle protein n=1 Tax=Euphydryas editha TaxID=104508 RepID=A0AAU9U0A5_EUPED|nr:unnamed protein product [Euphydryas editha]
MLKLVVLFCVLAATSAVNFYGGYVAPFAPLAYAAPYLQPYNYRGPLSLAPGQPANVLGADGRPLDTLDVNLDRSAHFTAKALDNGFHILKKRSAAFIAPVAASIATPLAYSTPLDYSARLAYSAPLSYSALYQPNNYRGPLSLAPGQPANILGADGRPLDTLDVNLDRSAHFTAKALDNGFHILKKRSAAFIAPVAASIATPLAYSTPLDYSARLAYSAPLSYSALYQPNNYRGPLSLAPGQPANILGADGRPLDTLDVNLDRSAHLTAKALSGGHFLKKRSAAFIAPISTVAVTGTPLIASSYTYSTPIAAAPLRQITYTAVPFAHYL